MSAACNKMASPWLCLLVLLGGLVSLSGSFDVTSTTPKVSVGAGEAADLYYQYTADFGDPRVEWKFKDLQGSFRLVYYNKQITESYVGRVELSTTALHFDHTLETDSGEYMCEVTTPDGAHTDTVMVELVVRVPPGVPVADVPSSVVIGSKVQLQCAETQGYPPPVFRWYRNEVPMPVKPVRGGSFRNSSYTIQPDTGQLTFDPVGKADIGDYKCEASNGVGEPIKSSLHHMQVYESNVGGIVAGVIVALIILAFIGIGLWFAYRKGYLGRKESNKPKVIYSQPPADTTDDGDFRQKSSFVV
ncbi:junctional adhesion molecule A-like [Rhinoraja longicauda]